MAQTIKDECNDLRSEVLKLRDSVDVLHKHSTFSNEQSSAGLRSEMHANLTLACRYLEDAHVRLGNAYRHLANDIMTDFRVV